jgi:hypothetical protein
MANDRGDRVRTALRVAGLAWMAGVFAGCGDAGPKPPAVRTTRVEDPVNGFRIAIPEGWVAEELPSTDPRRRWFAGRWKPAQATSAADGLFVHLLSPGCAASDLGGRFGGAPVASEVEPEGFSVISSAPASLGSLAAFRIDGKYSTKKLGDLFESTIYVETDPGCGLLVTSRGLPKDEALVRARLQAALAGFERIKREIRVGPPALHPGGIAISVPEGFDEVYGPAAYGTISFATGAVDVNSRRETVSLVLSPPVPAGAQFLAALLADASKGLTRGSPRRLKILEQDVQGFTLSPPDSAPRYEVAVSMFRIGNESAALCIHAAMMPKGRALDILEAVSKTITVRPPAAATFQPVLFGTTRERSTLVPAGWDILSKDAVLNCRFEDPSSSPPGRDQGKAQPVQLDVTIEEDSLGNGTPLDAAKDHASLIQRNKGRVVALEEFSLPDTRPAARLVAATQVSYEFLLFVRVTPGSLARVHVSSPPGCSAYALKAAEEVLGSVKFVPFAGQRPPADAVLEASRKALPGLLEKARGRPPGTLWYLQETAGKANGAQQLTLEEGGNWTDRERRTAEGVSVELTRKGSPGRCSETLTTKHVRPGDAQPVVSTTESRIEILQDLQVLLSRKRREGEVREERFASPELWLPADTATSDGMLVAISAMPPGTYSFVSVEERFLVTRWIEYRVLGEEEVEVPAGKFKARRVESGTRTVHWIADGKVVKAEIGGLTRKLCPEEAARAFFKD